MSNTGMSPSSQCIGKDIAHCQKKPPLSVLLGSVCRLSPLWTGIDGEHGSNVISTRNKVAFKTLFTMSIIILRARTGFQRLFGSQVLLRLKSNEASDGRSHEEMIWPHFVGSWLHGWSDDAPVWLTSHRAEPEQILSYRTKQRGEPHSHIYGPAVCHHASVPGHLLGLKCIVGTSVVQVVTQTADHQGQYLCIRQDILESGCLPKSNSATAISCSHQAIRPSQWWEGRTLQSDFTAHTTRTQLMLPLTYCDHHEHALRHIEGMPPVMIRHSSIVLPHSQKPATQNLRGGGRSFIQVATQMTYKYVFFPPDDKRPHLVVDFKLLNDTELQKHPEWRSDHGVVVQREVVEVKLIDA